MIFYVNKMKNKFTVYEKDGLERIDYFDEHWYKLPSGNIVPSVTSVIGLATNKGYGFDQWLRDTGNESKTILREAAESGSKVHNGIENLLLGNSIRADDYNFNIREWKKLHAFKNWWGGFDTDVKQVEYIVYSEEWGVAGTVDLLADIDGKMVMIDWKTGNNVHETAYQQLAAYFYMSKSLGLPADEAWVVHVGAKNKKLIKVNEVDVEKWIKRFKLSLDTYKFDYPKKRAPSLEFPIEISLDKLI